MTTILQETFTLPSKGLIYDPPINPEVKIRSMTTDEEALRLNPKGERAYKNMADIMDACMEIEAPISSYDMCMGDYQFLMYKLRTVTHDNIYKVVSKCKYCLQEHNDEINLDELPLKTYDKEIEEMRNITLPKTGKRIHLNYMTPRRYDNANIMAKEKERAFPAYKGDFRLLTSLIQMIDTVDGEKLSQFEIEEFLKSLPLADTNLIVNTIDKITEAIGYSNLVEYNCPVCGLNYTSGFHITGEFFRPSL